MAVGNAATLAIQVVTDASDAAKGVDQASSSLTKMGTVAKTAFAALGAASVAALGKGLADAFDADQLNAKLTAQLGLTAKESAKAGKVAGELYGSNYGDSMEQVNDAIKSVISNIDGMRGASEKTLALTARKALNVANVFDQDLGSVTKAVSQMMRTGLAKSSTEAFDIITKGFQSGVDASEDYLDTLNEYGTQFRKMGLDGAAATGLLMQGLKGGARDADLVADAIKEFSIRAVDGSKTTAQGFKMIGLSAKDMTAQIAKGGPSAAKGLDKTLDALRAIKDPAKQSQAAVALFGTQAEDLGKALYKLDPSKATKALGKFNGAEEKLNKTINDTPTAQLQAFGRQVQQSLTEAMANALPIIEKFIPLLSPLADHMGEVAVAVAAAAAAFALFKTAQAAIAGYSAVVGGVAAATQLWNNSLLILRVRLLAMAAAEKIATAATLAWNVATKAAALAMKVLKAAFIGNPVGLLVVGLMAAVAALILLWKKSETFRNVVMAIWHAIAAAANAAWSAIKVVIAATINWAKGFLKGFAGVAKSIWHAIGSVARVVWAGIKLYVRAVVTAIKLYLKAYAIVAKAIWKAVSAVAKATWQATKAVISGVINGAKAALRGLKTVASGIWFGIKTVATTAWRGIKAVVDTVVGAIKRVLSSLTGAASRVFNGIKNVAIKALNAIMTPIRAIKDAIEGLFDKVDGLINKIKSIKLPSLGGWVPDLPFSAVAPTPAPAYAAPAPYAAAPTLGGVLGRRAGSSVSGGGGAPVVVINVSGTLNDADSARAVRRVLRNDSRRRNGVTIDRRRTVALD